MFFIFFFNDTATTEIYTLSLHDALPISRPPGRPLRRSRRAPHSCATGATACARRRRAAYRPRSEEHTSELQSHSDIVCRLLLEKKKTRPASSTPASTERHASRSTSTTAK